MLDDSMTGQHDLLAHVEDSIANGDFDMTNLIELLAFGGTQSDVCAGCGQIVAPDLLISMPVTVEADVLLCEECMAPIREEHAREEAQCDGSSDDPLQEGFHGSDELCDILGGESIEDQIRLFPRLHRSPRQWTCDQDAPYEDWPDSAVTMADLR